MNKLAIYHLSDLPFAFPVNENTLRLRLKTEKNDMKKVIVHYIDRYEFNEIYASKEMSFFTSDDFFDYYVVDISQKYNRYRYFFELVDKDNNRLYYNERGFYLDAPIKNDSFGFIYPYICKTDLYESVAWLKDGIVYQVFPSRYAKGNIHHESLEWGSIKTNVTNEMNFGGDLRGIINKIPYMSELGITILYMTPIFSSPSNHKYDTRDYFNVDPSFGTNDDLVELVDKCHKQGIKVILDAVLNHSGSEFFAFKDVLENQEKSKYKDWFYLDEFPVTMDPLNYYCFANNVPSMPKLNYSCQELRKYFLDFATFWIKKADIDGWRLDIGNEVPHEFWQSFKAEVRRIKKDFIISGEVFNNASPFLRGQEFDSTMNYMFRYSIKRFIADNDFDAARCINFIENNRTLYTDKVNSQLWNLIDSHDTSRFLTDCNCNESLLKLAAAIQFTYIGVPFVYYGTEVGLEGNNDPDNRRCMIWKNQNVAMLDFYKKMIRIRRENKILIDGNLRVLFAKGDILVYERELDKSFVRVFINKGIEDVRFDGLDVDTIDLFTGMTVKANGEVILKGKNFLILKGVKNG